MFLKNIKGFLSYTLPSKYNNEFEVSTFKYNVANAKIISIVCIILEVILIGISIIMKKHVVYENPHIYYLFMYFIMIFTMTIYLIILERSLKNRSIRNIKTSSFLEISFVSFMLLWSAIITLMDQQSYGQVTVYATAIIATAILPYLKPYISLIVYSSIHTLFIIALLFFYGPTPLISGHIINTTIMVVICWNISRILYMNHLKTFRSSKIIKEKNEKLSILTKELAETNDKLKILSYTDCLTGIYNRRKFDDFLDQVWRYSMIASKPLSIIMIDIDFFKKFNDLYGHQAGDKCLREVASVIHDCAKGSSNLVSRYGGEEFVVILPNINKEKVCKIAELIRKRVEELAIPNNVSPVSKYVTVSLGTYSVVPSNDLSIEEFVGKSDKALYQAKQNKRNTIISA